MPKQEIESINLTPENIQEIADQIVSIQPIINPVRFFNATSYKDLYSGESSNQPSQTIPNQTMSLQDLVNRFTISSEWPKTPLDAQFDNEDTLDLPDISKMDKMEQEEYKISIQKFIDDTKEEISEQQLEALAAKKHQDEVNALLSQPQPEDPQDPQDPNK